MTANDTKLHHEDLDSYQVAIEFLALVAGFLEELPRGKTLLHRVISMLVKMTC